MSGSSELLESLDEEELLDCRVVAGTGIHIMGGVFALDFLDLDLR